MNTLVAEKSGLAITMVVAFSSSSEYSADSVRVAGYEQINDEYAENSCVMEYYPKASLVKMSKAVPKVTRIS